MSGGPRDRLPVAAGLLVGLAADRLLGDPRRGHPVALFGAAMTALEDRMWRHSRVAGGVYAGLGAALGSGPVLVLDRALRGRPVARTTATAVVVWAALGGRSLAGAGCRLGEQIAQGDLTAARALAPTLVGRDPATLDAAGLARAGLESVAENTSDAVVAPLVWGALLGGPGVALHRALNTMDAMVGHRSTRYERFGWASARADDVAGWPAARLAALLTCGAAATLPVLDGRPDAGPATDAYTGPDDPPRARPDSSADGGPHVGPGRARDAGSRTPGPPAGRAAGRAAWRAWRRDGHRHPSPNAGRVEAAFAGALGVRLGGRNVYGGRTEDRPLLGDGPHVRDPAATDLQRAAALSLRVGSAAGVLCAGAALVRPRWAG